MGLHKKVRGEEPETKEDETIVDSIEQQQRGRYRSILRELRERSQITFLKPIQGYIVTRLQVI